MQTVAIDFLWEQQPDIEFLEEQVHGLLSIWRNHGQVSLPSWLTHTLPTGWRVFAAIPEPGALNAANDTIWARRTRAELEERGIRLEIRELGEDLLSATGCLCTSPSCYILYTMYLSLESPVRCGDCFGPVPLYRLPVTDPDNSESLGLLHWASNWQACDSLQMQCTTLERAATREIRQHDGSLGRSGKAQAEHLSARMGKPFYLYLYPPHPRKKRPCPSCGGAWDLSEDWHRFAFRCNTCHLVSHREW